MPRTSYVIFTFALISVTCISGLSSSAGPFEPPVVKSTPVQSKVVSKSLLGLGSDAEYALNSLAIPYIKNPKIRKSFARFYRCGTPAMYYMMTHGMPSPQLLIKRAAIIEARWVSDFQ